MIILRREEDRKDRIRKVNGSQMLQMLWRWTQKQLGAKSVGDLETLKRQETLFLLESQKRTRPFWHLGFSPVNLIWASDHALWDCVFVMFCGTKFAQSCTSCNRKANATGSLWSLQARKLGICLQRLERPLYLQRKSVESRDQKWWLRKLGMAAVLGNQNTNLRKS